MNLSIAFLFAYVVHY